MPKKSIPASGFICTLTIKEKNKIKMPPKHDKQPLILLTGAEISIFSVSLLIVHSAFSGRLILESSFGVPKIIDEACCDVLSAGLDCVFVSWADN